MNEDLAALARDKAGGYFKQGYNCAEAILRAFLDILSVPHDPQVARLASPFGGGLGRSGCTCGALTGSEMVLGMVAGRDGLDKPLGDIYTVAGKLHDRFAEKFGSTCCRVLNPDGDFESREHLRRCLKITGGTAQMLAEFLQEQNLVSEEMLKKAGD